METGYAPYTPVTVAIKTATSTWHAEWSAAEKEMALAEEQHRLADIAMAEAAERFRAAKRRCAELFRQRMDELGRG